MKKDYFNDYAVMAFRAWAVLGCPTYDECPEICKRKDHIPASFSIDAGDILACCLTFRELKQSSREYISDAVREIYMADPTNELERGDVSARAVKYALKVPASERQVYRWLEEAKELFWKNRTL